MRANKKVKPEKDETPNLRMFFCKNTTERYIEKLDNCESRKLLKSRTTNFFLTFLKGTLKIGTVIRKTWRLFQDIEAFNTYIDQIQLKYDVDDALFTGYLIKFYYSRFEKIET